MRWRRRDPADGAYQAALEAAVPSAVDYLDFRLRCTVGWDDEPDLRPFALRAVTERAASTLGRHHPTRWQVAEIEVAADLAEVQVDPKVVVHARDVAVAVDDEHLALARQHASRQRELAEQAAADHAELRYLRDSVLADPVIAAVWWLRRNDFDLDRVEAAVPRLRAVLRAVANSDVPGWVDQFQELIEVAVGRLDRVRAVDMAERFGAVLEALGALEQANQLRKRALNLP
jgi:hypothetical protein